MNIVFLEYNYHINFMVFFILTTQPRIKNSILCRTVITFSLHGRKQEPNLPQATHTSVPELKR